MPGLLSIGAFTWYHSFDGFWCLGKLKERSNIPGRYVIRFHDNSGPVLIDLSDSACNTALHAPCVPSCLQPHVRINSFSMANGSVVYAQDECFYGKKIYAQDLVSSCSKPFREIWGVL